MVKRAGMSQTLALIVAASVLMMTALTVIFMVQGGLGDVGKGTSSSSCVQTINAKCSTTSGTVSTPISCHQDGQPAPGVPQWIPQSPDAEVSCSQIPQ
ncbi:MAG: hypothetical protein ABEJ56_06770 [Candidatus Nanohaloarchaea archaeon]